MPNSPEIPQPAVPPESGVETPGVHLPQSLPDVAHHPLGFSLSTGVESVIKPKEDAPEIIGMSKRTGRPIYRIAGASDDPPRSSFRDRLRRMRGSPRRERPDTPTRRVSGGNPRGPRDRSSETATGSGDEERELASQQEQQQRLVNRYRDLDRMSGDQLRASLESEQGRGEPMPFVERPAEVGVTEEIIPPGLSENPTTPEALSSVENREVLSSLDNVVRELRRLEALPVNERYTEDNLKALARYYNQIEEYAASEDSPELTLQRTRLRQLRRLEGGLRNGRTSNQRLLEFVDSLGGEDPGLSGMRRKIQRLESAESLTTDQSLMLLDLRRDLENKTDPQRMIPALEQRMEFLSGQLQGRPPRQQIEQQIADLTQRRRTLQAQSQDLSEAELAELESSRGVLRNYDELEESNQAYQDFLADPNPNRLMRRVEILRRDPARHAELRSLLIDILRQERGQAESEIALIEKIRVDSLINKYLGKAGESESDRLGREERELDNLREQAAERIEKFEDIPPMGAVMVAYDQAERAGDRVQLELAERRIERYFYHANRLGITNRVHAGFDNLLTNLRRPQVQQYGDIRGVSDDDVTRLTSLFGSQEDPLFYRRFGWEFNKFGGVRVLAAQYAERSVLHALDLLDNPNTPDLARRLRGEWDLDKVDRKISDEAQTKLLWERNYAGYYTISINPESPFAKQQLETVSNQWIVLMMQSGVIPKNPNEQLGEFRKFIEQWVSVALKIYENDTELVGRLRRQLKFRVEAPVTAYFNSTDDAESFATMNQNLSDDSEGADVWDEGYAAYGGKVARLLHRIESDPQFSVIFFQPEGSRGYLSANNPAQRLLRATIINQLIDEEAECVISENTPLKEAESQRINAEIERLRNELEASQDDPRRRAEIQASLKPILMERADLSRGVRAYNLDQIRRDQPAEAFDNLYGKLTDQFDFKYLSEAEQKSLLRQNRQETEAAAKLALEILNITGQQSARGGATIKIRDAKLLDYEWEIETQKAEIADFDRYIKKQQGLHNAHRSGAEPEAKIEEARVKRAKAAEALKDARRDRRVRLSTLKNSSREVDKREDRVPVRTMVRFGEYAVDRAERLWTQEADKIMKDPNLNDQQKDVKILALSDAMIPAAWNLKPSREVMVARINADQTLTGEQRQKAISALVVRRNSLSDVLEGIYRDALDRGFKHGFRATLEVPEGVEYWGEAFVVQRSEVKDASGKVLYMEDIDRLPEAGSMLMAYYGTEEITGDAFALPHRVDQAKAGGGGLMGRALRKLDPAFNRFSREDDPTYLRNRQDLQRALNAGIEAQWQRHFQIKTEVLERCVIGADIRKNKTGNPADRYKIIDGNPRANLLEFGREEVYVTGRIINHGAEVLTHPDRRTRRAPDLTGIYTPMQHESLYDESNAQNSREFFMLNTGDKIPQTDFLYYKLKGDRWRQGYRQRVALEGGVVEGGKQHVGLGEKVFSSADRLRKLVEAWDRAVSKLEFEAGVAAIPDPGQIRLFGPASHIVDIERDASAGGPLRRQHTEHELQLQIEGRDIEWEDFITLSENVFSRLGMSLDTLYPDLSQDRLLQAPLWKDGLDSFLPDGTLNFEMDELEDTLRGSDNGTSRHTAGIMFDRTKQWMLDRDKCGVWYPGAFEDISRLNVRQYINRQEQVGFDVLKSRMVR